MNHPSQESPNHPRDQQIFVRPFLQSNRFMCTECHERFWADDVSNPPSLGTGSCKRFFGHWPLLRWNTLGRSIASVHQLFVPLFVSNVLFGSMFLLHPYIYIMQDFFHQQSLWSGCIVHVWCVMLFSFCFMLFHFFGWGGHDCRSPRKPPDEAHMQQSSNSLIFVFLPAGLFS